MPTEPSPRYRRLAVTLMAGAASAGRLLRWVGALLILASPVILAVNAERLGEVARQLALGLLAWAALCLVWSLLTVGLRQWIWWVDRRRGT